MGRLIGGLFSNESTIGRIMTALWIIIASNILFVLFSLPVVTIGPGLAALHYVMLRRLHSDSSLSPVRTFWKGFRVNLRQGSICWILFIGMAAFLTVDIRFCAYRGGILTWFKYALYAILFLAAILMIYLMPVMAAFEDTIPHLIRNALFFAGAKPLKAAATALIWAAPFLVTYLDERMRPLYGFLWTTCGFGILAAVTSSMLYKDIARYLPKPDSQAAEAALRDGARAESAGKAGGAKSERRIRAEMKKLDR